MADPFDLSNLVPGDPRDPDASGAAPTPRVAADDYLARLNEAQREAVAATEGPVLVLAGAGTGKTRVLTTRIAHLLVTGRAWPGQILAVTFTNKAAREMANRVAGFIGDRVDGLWLGTFHSIGARILRRHAELVGLKPNFTIIDTDDQLRLLKQVLSAHDIDEKRWPVRSLLTIIQRWKDRGLGPGKADAQCGGEFAGGRAQALYRAYQERLVALNAADFGDLLLHCLTLFKADREVLEGWQRRFRYILVDEYQDTNVAQYLWLRLLARAHKNLCCVGDDDQSIYGWRSAEVGNILRFEHDFKDARVIRLERNYRSTKPLLGAASGLIAHNAGRLGKTLWTDEAGGEKVSVRGVWDDTEEARVVGEEIEALAGRGHRLSEVAVLVRAGFQTRAFEERFIVIGLAYRVIGGLRFYERQEIRDAVAYMRVTVQPDDDLAFERVVNLPKRGLGNASLRVVHQVARAGKLSLVEAARAVIESDELRPAPRAALDRLIGCLDRWRALLDTGAHPEVVATMLDESGYTAMWQRDTSAAGPGRLENLKELVRALAEFDTLQDFLEHVSLVMDADDRADGDMVNVMTLHSAKGLEFDTVFLPGWEAGLFPHQRALDENGAKGLEEERRLAYVGLTRARKRALVSFAANRRIYNQWQSSIPSCFVDELPDEHVERIAATGLYQGPGADPSAWSQGTRAGGAPGWRQRRPRAIEAEPIARAEGAFAVGARVFHEKFGYGRVNAVDGNKLAVAFDKAGSKKVIDSFVKLVK